MKNRSSARRIGRLVLIGLMLVIFADVAVGYLVRVDSTAWCKSHAIDKSPGRGPGTPSWSTDQYTAILHNCRIAGLEAQLEFTQMPFNEALVARRLERAIAQCDDLPVEYDGWGCYDR